MQTGEITNLNIEYRSVVDSILRNRGHSTTCMRYESLNLTEQQTIISCFVKICDFWGKICNPQICIYYYYSDEDIAQASVVRFVDGNFCVILYKGLSEIRLIAFDVNAQSINLPTGSMQTRDFIKLQLQATYLFIVLHEIGHIVHGHFGSLHNIKLNIIDEKAELHNHKMSILRKHYLELDADTFAVSKVLQILFYYQAPSDWPRLAIVMGVLLNIYRHFYGNGGGAGLTLKSHPRPSIRWFFAMQAFHKTRFGKKQDQLDINIFQIAYNSIMGDFPMLSDEDKALLTDFASQANTKEFDEYLFGLVKTFKAINEDLNQNKLWGNICPLIIL